MRTFLSTHWKTLVAILILVFVALLTLSPSAASPDLAAQLRQHVHVLTHAPPGSVPARLVYRSRYIAAVLHRYGYTVHTRQHHGNPVPDYLEASLATSFGGARPARILAAGVEFAAADDATGIGAVLELARLMRHTHPLSGTDIRFVFLPSAARSQAGAESRNFIAFAGPRSDSDRAGQVLARFGGAGGAGIDGLASPAYSAGVRLWNRHDALQRATPVLALTEARSLRSPYYRADLAADADCAGLARVVHSLALTIGALAGTTRS